TGAFQRPDAQDGQRLFNVTKLVPENIRWSRRHNGQNELLDHILTSEALMPRVGGLRQVPTMSILNEDPPNMIGPHPVAGGVVPDHAPVTATFLQRTTQQEENIVKKLDIEPRVPAGKVSLERAMSAIE